MSGLFLCVLIILFLWYEQEIVGVALAPLIDILISIIFIVLLFILVLCEVALILIAPIAFLLGKDSREWHKQVAKKIMLEGVIKKNGS